MPREEEINRYRCQLDAILRETQARIEHIFSVNHAVSLRHGYQSSNHSNLQSNREVQVRFSVESINQCIELAVGANNTVGNIISLLKNGTLSDTLGVQRKDGELQRRLWTTESQNAVRNECTDAEVQKVDCSSTNMPWNNTLRKIMDGGTVTGNSSLHKSLDDGKIEEDLFVEEVQHTESSEKQSSGCYFDSEDENIFGDDDQDLILELDEIEKSLIEDKSSIKQIKESVEIARPDCPTPDVKYIDILKTSFGFGKFRPVQWKVIRSVLVHRKDNCVVMATGSGKSLCYQYPSVFDNGLTLVVSPLISLMEDQVRALR